jgi:hypothetical protein
MRVVKVDSSCYLVEWKYRDFLRIGYEFQGGTIVRLEKFDHFGSDYIRVFLEPAHNKI